jgi:hypothetical protein
VFSVPQLFFLANQGGGMVKTPAAGKRKGIDVFWQRGL